LGNYLRELQLEKLFNELGVSNPRILAKTVRHFTTEEAEKRDEIVVSYFGRCGVNQIVEEITKFLLAPPRLSADAEVLDVGAGSGFFTVKVAEKIRARLPRVEFSAMDLTPAMLLSLAEKKAKITSFIGVAENIRGSIERARSFFKIPNKFDAVFSTLMLHHSIEPEKVFESLRTVLKRNGKVAVIDLCEHSFEEFRTEMGDVHLGFKPESVRSMAQKYFSRVNVEKMPGICCKSSGRSAEIFVATMRNRV
jgi:ubiquinone/menaquinone biosynthesis C-methylase UbiE